MNLKTDLERLEFHRNAFALMPRAGDEKPGVAILLLGNSRFSFRGCTCNRFQNKTCKHLLELAAILKAVKQERGSVDFEGGFNSTLWFHLAQILAEPCRVKPDGVDIEEESQGEETVLKVFDSHKNRHLLTYISNSSDRSRLLERMDKLAGNGSLSRGDALDRLIAAALNDNERELMRCGMRSRGLVVAESFWYRFAYHAYREIGTGGFSFVPEIDKENGDFRLAVLRNGGPAMFRIVVPRSAVKRILNDPKIPLSEKKGFSIHPNSVVPIMAVKKDAAGCLRLYPQLMLEKQEGEIVRYSIAKVSKYRFGDLVLFPGEKMFVPLARPDARLKEIGYPEKRVIPKRQVPGFLAEYGDFLNNGRNILDGSAAGLKVFRESDRLEIVPEKIDRDWCWLSVKYGYGNDRISLVDLLRARKKGERYIATSEGWVDATAEELEVLDLLDGLEIGEEAGEGEGTGRISANKGEQIRLSRMDLFRLQAGTGKYPEFSGDKDKAEFMRKFFETRPSTPPPDIGDSISPLRGYQARGAEWLWFLYENGFGGLLCDDMGLGKTHQVMALMQFLKHKDRTPFLVVCPTTVMSHWERKLNEHAPGLVAESYYGGDRNLDESREKCDALITSYGIVLRDAKALSKIRFSLAVFDEIQHIKNPDTKTYGAARKIKADMKVGLTGTPVENSVCELKALMDITTPGYLGANANFERRYVKPLESNPNASAGSELARLVFPFTLRRLKTTVLKELPEKIEDIRSCSLSDDQVRLYRQAIEARERGVIENLKSDSARIPYIHVFALLSLLKQICDHPALLKNKPEEYRLYESGKWELFKEILEESVESGQKVVVYSQFVGMVEIIERHLREKNIGTAVLTGKSNNRGDIVNRFNDDPDCRVFVGSLKAGGTGIDLVSASVVIHYDRWWNAAREDQATDRVHRIGQRRGVHVFKLVTKGTLEEKISRIIERKRNLMESVVREDDPGLLKTFTRRELLDMLSMPG